MEATFIAIIIVCIIFAIAFVILNRIPFPEELAILKWLLLVLVGVLCIFALLRYLP